MPLLPKIPPKIPEPRRKPEPKIEPKPDPVNLSRCKQDSEPQDILWGCLEREIKVIEKRI